MKAHRCCNMKDMYNPQRPILETLTRDMSTMRVRDILPGEKVDSVWDDIKQSRSVSLDIYEQRESENPWGESYFYNEADAAEDIILFPEEMSTGHAKSVYKAGDSAIDKFMRKGPDFDRFVMDLETDEEFDDTSSSEVEDDYLITDQPDIATSHEDGDHRLVTYHSAQGEPKSLPLEAAYAILCQDALSTPHTSSSNSESGEETSVEERGAKGAGRMQETELETLHSVLTDDQKQELAVLKNWKSPQQYGSIPEKDWISFLDREKSKGELGAIGNAIPFQKSRRKCENLHTIISPLLRGKSGLFTTACCAAKGRGTPIQILSTLRTLNTC